MYKPMPIMMPIRSAVIMINSSGGFNDQYEVPNNRIVYCRNDLDHSLSSSPTASNYFLERQTKQAIVELANTFIDEVLDCNHQLEDTPNVKLDFLLRNVAIKFPELKEMAQLLYSEHLQPNS
jgi:hypothetical protein